MKYLYPKSLRKFICAVVSFFSVFAINAQDLPGTTSNLQTAPAGTYVIAMDNVNQAASSINVASNSYLFNLKSYGLAVYLLDVSYKLKWVIKAGKSKDATDFTAMAERLTPTYQSAQLLDFKSGPILIFPQDSLSAHSTINLFNSFLPDSCKVKVYRLQSDVTVDVRYNLTRPPKAALLHDSCDIHRNFMEMASVPQVNYKCLPNASTLRSGCYTIVTDPHVMSGDLTSYDADSIYNFVMAGGNLLAECEGVETFEALKKYHSTTGVIADPSGGQYANFNNNVTYDNPDMAYGQYQGSFRPWLRGAQKVWRYTSGTINNFYSVTSCKRNAADNVHYVAAVSKMTSDTGSLVFYLGNHEYFTNDCHTCTSGTNVTQEEINGIRMYLNAVLMPSKFWRCVNVYDIPLAVSVTSFNVTRLNGSLAHLQWATTDEEEGTLYLIEHSQNGRNYSIVGQVNANELNGVNNYYFNHDNAMPGLNYYRIKIVSITGKHSYSDVKKLMFDSKQHPMHIFPNPATDHRVQLMLDVKDGEKMLIEFYDIKGQLAGQVLSVIRNQKAELNIHQLPKGYYMVIGSTLKGDQYKTKLIVQ